MIYENNYSKTFYLNNGKKYGNGYLELKVVKFKGMVNYIELTDGFQVIAQNEIHNFKHMVRMVKQYKKQLKQS